MEKATFGAGCFWGVEETFRRTKGVVNTAVGYEGGLTNNPTYKDVCTDRTGHAEVVQVEFDPKQVSYDQLLDIFWHSHNPTTLNRQGPDVGSQYRSVIFFHSPEQEKKAAASKEKTQKRDYKSPIVTQIVPAAIFWKAEDYHQQYLAKRGLDNCHL
jgi:peptide-methionine (S)-S-oxide reductase